MKKLFLLLIAIACITNTFAQKSFDNKDLKMKEYQKIRELFQSSIDRKAFKDTNQMILFALKINVIRSGKNVNYQRVDVTDNYAYQLFKDFHFLSRIDFKLFLGKSKQATFVFPIAIALVHPDKKNPGLVLAEDVLKSIIPFLSIHDSNEKFVPVYDYIYIPAITVITTTNEDI